MKNTEKLLLIAGIGAGAYFLLTSQSQNTPFVDGMTGGTGGGFGTEFIYAPQSYDATLGGNSYSGGNTFLNPSTGQPSTNYTSSAVTKFSSGGTYNPVGGVYTSASGVSYSTVNPSALDSSLNAKKSLNSGTSAPSNPFVGGNVAYGVPVTTSSSAPSSGSGSGSASGLITGGVVANNTSTAPMSKRNVVSSQPLGFSSANPFMNKGGYL